MKDVIPENWSCHLIALWPNSVSLWSQAWSVQSGEIMHA
jgi:hypothetical protein